MDTQAAAVLQVQALHKRYAGHTVLNNVSLSLQSGELVTILGPNGAGKTTLISAMLGLVATNAGQISLFGQLQAGMQRSQALRQKLGVMMQIGSLTANLTVKEQCDLFASYYADSHTAAELLAISGLEHSADTRFGRLSGGQKQRLLFALALAGKPQLLFLDEPTLGMDVAARHGLWQQIRRLKQQGVSVVLTTHYLEEAEQLADRILVLRQGQIIANGSPAELKALSQHKFIHCHSSLTDAQLLALPAVQQLQHQTDDIILQSHNAEQTLRALLAQDATVCNVEVRPVALEQAFLQLTQTDSPQTGEQAA